MGADGEGGGKIGNAPLSCLFSSLFEVILKAEVTASAPLFSLFVSFNYP